MSFRKPRGIYFFSCTFCSVVRICEPAFTNINFAFSFSRKSSDSMIREKTKQNAGMQCNINLAYVITGKVVFFFVFLLFCKGRKNSFMVIVSTTFNVVNGHSTSVFVYITHD